MNVKPSLPSSIRNNCLSMCLDTELKSQEDIFNEGVAKKQQFS